MYVENIKPDKVSGYVTWKRICNTTGKVLKSETFKNLITYQGSTVLNKSLAGVPGFKVTHIYGEHADPGGSGYVEGSLNGLSTDRQDTVETLRTSPRETTDAEVPILLSSFATTTEISGVPTTDYDQNITSYFGVIDNPALDGRIFVGSGLVTQINDSEILVTHQYRPALIKLSSFHINIIWSLRFL